VTRRALIIGLGMHTEALLQAARTVFAAHDRLDDVRLIWLVPSSLSRKPDDVEVFPLELNRDALNQLYYHPNVRAMSTLNWKSWRERIPSNRLWGKLAAYRHLYSLQERLNKLSVDLATDDAKVNYYLLAHLHDPFASGALLDCAYLLNQLAVQMGGSVYGMLLLPGITGDPVVKQDMGEDDDLLRQATAYAALRELNFALGEHSFYDAHHDKVMLSPKKKEVFNESPFQTGDCYLIGGRRDEKLQKLDYDKSIPANCARWMYLQTCTLMKDRIERSTRGHVTAFAVYVPQAGTREAEIDAPDPVIAALLRRITRGEGVPRDTSAVDYWFDLHLEDHRIDDSAVEMAVNSLGAVDDERGSADRIELLELQFNDAIIEVSRLEEMWSRGVSQQLDAAMRTLNPSDADSPLAKIRRDTGATLYLLQEYYRAVLNKSDALYEDHAGELERLEQLARTRRNMLTEQRDRYRYAAAPFTSPFNLTLFLTVVALGVFLILVEQGLLGLLIMIGGFILIRSIQITFRGGRLRDARSAYIRAQRNLLQTQIALVEQRVTCAYIFELGQYLHKVLRGDVEDTRAERIVSYLNGLAGRLTRRLAIQNTATSTTLEVSETKWQQFAPTLTNKLWMLLNADPCVMKGDPLPDKDEQIRKEVRLLAHSENLLRPQEAETEALGKLIGQMGERTAPTLMFKETAIGEGERDYELRSVAFADWNPLLIEELTTIFQRYGLHPERLYTTEEYTRLMRLVGSDMSIIDDRLEQPMLREISVNVRYNIPISALLDIQTWRNAYMNKIQVMLDGRIVTFRGLLHPTRLGCATADLTRNFKGAGFDDDLRFLPETGMIVAIFMRCHQQDVLVNRIIEHLQLFRRGNAMPSLDELSGAISEAENVIPMLIQRCQDENMTPEQASGTLKHFLRAVSADDLKFSENCADWELWLLEWLRGLADSERPSDRSLRVAIALLCRYLTRLDGGEGTA